MVLHEMEHHWVGRGLFPEPLSGACVPSECSACATAVTPTQKEAIDRGRELAKAEESELVIQGKDGKIRQKDSFGNDPPTSKG